MQFHSFTTSVVKVFPTDVLSEHPSVIAKLILSVLRQLIWHTAAYAQGMKKLFILTVIGAVAGFGIIGPTSAQASTLQTENLILTLPDSVSISGTEIGGSNNPRKCSIKASLDSKAGTTIPLRAGAVINFVDSTGFGIDNGYAIADVEGLTHLDIVMVFKCGNGIGTATLKGPYKFSTIWRGTTGLPFAPETPVNVTFGSKETPAPSTSNGTDPAKDPLVLANEKISSLNKITSDQQLRILELSTQVTTLTSKLASAGKDVDSKASASAKNLTYCYKLAKTIAISKKGNLPKMCLSL